jgi:hypothetical protein
MRSFPSRIAYLPTESAGTIFLSFLFATGKWKRLDGVPTCTPETSLGILVPGRGRTCGLGRSNTHTDLIQANLIRVNPYFSVPIGFFLPMRFIGR